jgi:hypothetical protein
VYAKGGERVLIQLYRTGILNVRSVLMVGMEQHFIQASPIKHFATFGALCEVLFFVGRKLFVFVESHPSFRSVSLNAMVRSMFPLESKTRISPVRNRAAISAITAATSYFSAQARRRLLRSAGPRARNPIQDQDAVRHKMARLEVCSLSPTVVRQDPSRR